MKINNRVALVTGSGQGMGKTIAMTFAREGVKIVINDIPANKEKAFMNLKEINTLGIEAELFFADVTNEEQVNQMIQGTLEKFGKLDILVNNAGINKDGILHKANLEKWNSVIAVNLTGPLVCTKAVLPIMRKQNYGRIINISSVTARMAIFGTGYYATSKAGLIGLTKVTAIENASKGITVNALAPGYIKTDMLAEISQDQLEVIKSKIPVGRFAEPEEIAEAVLFLASDSSSYITGSVLDINGGFYI
jgi:3-oxoacyl-[acyl-carrier protein] reductase